MVTRPLIQNSREVFRSFHTASVESGRWQKAAIAEAEGDLGGPQPIDGFQEQRMTPTSQYSRFSQWFAQASGRPVAFILALGLTIAWILLGPVFHFSDTWQLVMNTISSIVTFLMVFAIQNTQNRQTDALQIKLDELIRATQGAHNALLDLEELEDTQLKTFRDGYTTLAHQAREDLKRGLPDTDTKDT
jgi:low affinity Fe/Cu permease